MADNINIPTGQPEQEQECEEFRGLEGRQAYPLPGRPESKAAGYGLSDLLARGGPPDKAWQFLERELRELQEMRIYRGERDARPPLGCLVFELRFEALGEHTVSAVRLESGEIVVKIGCTTGTLAWWREAQVGENMTGYEINPTQREKLGRALDLIAAVRS